MCVNKVINKYGMEEVDYTAEFDYVGKDVDIEGLSAHLQSIINSEKNYALVDGMFHGVKSIRKIISKDIHQNGVMLRVLKYKINGLISLDIELEERDKIFKEGVLRIYIESLNVLSEGKFLVENKFI